MLKPEIILRVDGGAHIGLGHLVRSLALAQILEDYFSITFVVKEAPPFFSKSLLLKGFSYQQVTAEHDWLERLTPQQVVVLDGYHFSTALQRSVRQIGAELVCIDDLHDRPFEADLIINHSPGVTRADYTVMTHTRFALGPDYALLRPAFLNATHISRKIDTIESMMICFGGADVNNLTKLVLAWAVTKKQLKKIVVVTGAAYRYQSSLMSLRQEVKVEYYNNVAEQMMANLMLQLDVAVVPSSSVLLELIACGTIPIIGYTANNQKFLHDELVENYNFNSLGDCTCPVDKIQLDEALVNAKVKASDATRVLRERISMSRCNHINVFRKLIADE